MDKRLDLSALKSLESATNSGKCNPVVYYSVKPKEEFTAEDEVTRFNLNPGSYYVREVSAPANYNTSEDIPFTIDEDNSGYTKIERASVNSTSSHPINGKPNGTPFVKDDHRNYGAYRLYTLVITYEGEGANQKGDSVDARAYIRYYDANGKLRVFYNNYNKTKYYGGCMCSYNQICDMALPKKPEEGEGTN